ncbi:MAG: tetratricopeptide repeat protein [Ardenticatenaceae bacterium]|nr:tetratricopeptide repeat protein [Ardenticatenaceae bacterium]
MPAHVSQTPFIIRPRADLLEAYPVLQHNANNLARLYANSVVVQEEHLQQIGQQLWQVLDVAEPLAQARQQAGSHILPIIIESDSAAIHQLPWETLYHPEHGFLGKHNGFTLSRRIPDGAGQLPDLQTGPLRVLLFTSLPDDLDADKERLDVEEEQAQISEALTPWIAQGLIELKMPDDGRFSTLQEFLRTFQPHLLFLSGHGKFVNEPHQANEPFSIFLFEDEHGRSQPIHEKAIADAFLGRGLGCVVLNACQLGKTASADLTNGLTWRLNRAGIPYVVGMRESVMDRAGTLFSRAFGDAVARQERIDVALQAGRQAIHTPLKDSPRLASGILPPDASGLAEQSLGQWCLPLLLARETERPLIDWQFTPRPPAERLINQTLHTVTLPPRFLGRRSELRDLKSRLRTGRLRQLLITGPGGQGKTALAGKLAQDLQQNGYLVAAYSARPENSWLDFILELELLLTAENADKYNRMLPRYTDEADKASLLLRLLMQQAGNKVVLFFDNLESLQDPHTQQLQDARLAAWITAAQGLAAPGLILLLTSRWRLPDWPEADLWPLSRANYGDFLQMARTILPAPFMQNRERLYRVYTTLHGNGRALTFFAAALQTLTGDEEETFLAQLAQAEADIQMNMALDLIVGHLEPAARALLERLPAYQTPVLVEGIIKLGLDLQPAVEQLLPRLLAVSLVEVTVNHAWQAVEYQLPPLVVDWLKREQGLALEAEFLRIASDYQHYLYRAERRTLMQALTAHQALRAAAQKEAADRFALDWIVGRLNRQGLYQTLLTEWLPDMCESDNLLIKAEALGQSGKQHLHLGNFSQALPFFQRSLKIWQEIGDKYGEGTTLNNISQIFKARGDYDTALDFLQRSLKISQEIGDKSGEGTTLNNISQIYDARGDYDTALDFLQRSLKISQEIGDKYGEGTTLNNMATTAHARGDYDTALDFLQRSLKISQEIGDAAGFCATMFNMGFMHWQNGEQDEAMSAWISAYQIARKINLAQVLQALDGLAGQLGLPGGLAAWERFAQQMES